MYKSKLQELCHQRSWNLPEYTTAREGPDHYPRFQSTVTVNNLLFQSRNLCKSSKEAQNDAAQVAFLHLSSPTTRKPSQSDSLPHQKQEVVKHSPFAPSSVIDDPQQDAAPKRQMFLSPKSASEKKIAREEGSFNATKEAKNNVSNKRTFDQERRDVDQIPPLNVPSQVNKDDNIFTEMNNLFKNHLQNYCQKRSLCLPTYSCEREGPPHASRFRGKVAVGDQTFESLEFLPTIKEAENAVAKVALTSLLPTDANQEVDYSFYKNLLQEVCQKGGYLLPVYNTVRSGEAHMPIFVSTVELEGMVFRGKEARTKKQAEMNAAKVAYMALKDGKPSQSASLPHQKQEVVKHSPSAPSNVIDDPQQDAAPKHQRILSPNSVSEEKIVREEAPSILDHSRDIHPSNQKPPKPESGDFPPLSPVSNCKDLVIDYGLPPPPETECVPNLNKSPSKPTASPSCNQMAGGTNCPPPRQRIVVRPRVPNMTFPPGSEVVMSDDKWVAMKLVPKTE